MQAINWQQATYEKVKAFAEGKPVVFIPSHDEDAGKRLKSLQTLLPQA